MRRPKAEPLPHDAFAAELQRWYDQHNSAAYIDPLDDLTNWYR